MVALTEGQRQVARGVEAAANSQSACVAPVIAPSRKAHASRCGGFGQRAAVGVGRGRYRRLQGGARFRSTRSRRSHRRVVRGSREVERGVQISLEGRLQRLQRRQRLRRRYGTGRASDASGHQAALQIEGTFVFAFSFERQDALQQGHAVGRDRRERELARLQHALAVRAARTACRTAGRAAGGAGHSAAGTRLGR